MAKRNKANKGKGKGIVAAFGAVAHGGNTYSAVMLASSKKGAIATTLWGIMPGQGKGAPAFVLVATLPGVAQPATYALTKTQGQASYNGHPRRVLPGQGTLGQFGLSPKPVAAPAQPAAPAPSKASA
jgi:hypothetical protein